MFENVDCMRPGCRATVQIIAVTLGLLEPNVVRHAAEEDENHRTKSERSSHLFMSRKHLFGVRVRLRSG